MEQKLTVQQLIEAGVHFGCRVSRWNPKMAPYIHGRRNAIHVIDLRQTMRGILRARNLLLRIASEGQTVLWVGTKRQVKGVIKDAGERTGMPIVTERWIGGSLTNFSVIRSRLKRLEELEGIDEKKVEEMKLTKKELATMGREQRKITRNLGGIREMSSMPGAMVVIDPSRELNAAREARRMGVLTIGILDTDCDPDGVDIVIPANDDALKSVRIVVEELIAAVESGWHQHSESAAALGVAEKHEEGVTDEVRPTRSQRAPKSASGSDTAEAEAAPAGEASATAVAEAEPVVVAEAEPVVVTEAEPVVVTEVQPAPAAPEPEAASQPEPEPEPEPEPTPAPEATTEPTPEEGSDEEDKAGTDSA